MIRPYIAYYNSRRLQRRLGVRTPLEAHALYAAWQQKLSHKIFTFLST